MNVKFYTDELLAKWRLKFEGQNGANNYRYKSEVFTGSYGDVSRMYSNYLKYQADTDEWHWTQVHQTSGHVSNQSETTVYNTYPNVYEPNIFLWNRLQDAAFVSLLNQDRETALSILDSIYVQMQYTHCDFTQSIWLQDNYSDVHPIFWVAKAFNILFLAMVYIDDFIPNHLQYKKTLILDRFEKCGDFMAEELNLNINIYFSNRALAVGTPNEVKVESLNLTGGNTSTGDYAHHGSANLWTINKIHNNRRWEMAFFCFLIGTEINDSYLINTAKQFYKEYFGFAIYGTYMAEMYRSADSSGAEPQKGFTYCSQNIIIATTMAYIQWLMGSTELLEYTTYHGVNSSNTTAPTQKGLKHVIDLFRKYFNGTYVYYVNGFSGNATYLLDGVSGTTIIWHDCLAAAMLHYITKDTAMLNQAKRIGADYTNVALTLTNVSTFGGDTLARYIVTAPFFMFLDN